MNRIKCCLETTKGRKSGEDKTGTRNRGRAAKKLKTWATLAQLQQQRLECAPERQAVRVDQMQD